jgi:S-adenosylmethionine synthetase
MTIRTAEFISPKHPDKLCDRISDSILYEYVKGDKDSRCAIETCGGHSKIFITGEITSKINVSDKKIKEIVNKLTGIDDIIIHIHQQSPRIAQGVDVGGAGDQGIMIGYACNENDELVPQEYYLARQLNRYIYSKYPFDGKTQITLDDNDVRVVASFQNAPKEDLKILVEDFFTQYPKYNIVEMHCNPAGDWEIGSFQADAGVTGRKLATDNYGPRVPLGGGAFSGKDVTKVDRSGAYMARKIAVDYLKKYDAKEVKVELSYAIGHDRPIQATAIITYDSGWGKDVKYISDYDLSPNGIIKYLNLKDIDYSETAKWGHMGLNFPWN